MTAYVVEGVELPSGEAAVWWTDGAGLHDQPVDGAERLPGRFVLPGLVDAHCHLTLTRGDAGPVPAPDGEVRSRLRSFGENGVLALRDTGAHDDTAIKLSVSDDGAVRVRACGRFLSTRGHYFPGVYEPVEPEQLVDAAIEQVRAGATWVKLVADFPRLAEVGTLPEPTFGIDVVSAMVVAVHDAGARVAAHVTTPLVADLVRVGIDSVEHGTSLDEATLQEMARRGTGWTPTLSAAFAPPPVDVPPGYEERQAARATRMRELLPHAASLGVPILTGSDVVGTVAGEVAMLASYGLTPDAALAAATTTARGFLGFDGLSAGAPADLVTYDEDPRDDPSVLARPAAVLANGVRLR